MRRLGTVDSDGSATENDGGELHTHNYEASYVQICK